MANLFYNRHSLRLKGYDYSQPGCYFVTICTWRREPILGSFSNEKMVVNDCGKIVEEIWLEMPRLYPYVDLDEFMVMTDHFHGVLLLTEGTQETRPNRPGLPGIIRSFKSQSARRINLIRDETGIPVWQRGYYDCIVRSEAELESIRKYILSNPSQGDVNNQFPTNFHT